MKNPLHLLSLLLLLAFNSASAQYCGNCNSNALFKQFLQTKKLMVQLSGDADYDSALTRAVSKYWKHGPFETASATQIERKLGDKTLAFLIPVNFFLNITFTSGASSTTRHPNDQLAVIVGGAHDISFMDMIAFATYEPDQSYIGDGLHFHEEDETKSALKIKFRLNDAVATMSHAIELLRDDVKCTFDNDPSLAVDYMNKKFYNPLSVVLKTKTLYVQANDIRHADKVPNAYPYKYKIVNEAEYKKAIIEERKDMVYLVLTHSQWGGVTLIDAAEHKCVGGILYQHIGAIDDGDMKAIAKLVAKAEKDQEKAKK